MKLLLISAIFSFNSIIISGFIFDVTPSGKGTLKTTTSPDICSVDVFQGCTDGFLSTVKVNGSNVEIDGDALRNFYCGSNATDAIQCLKDHIDPSCGPGTFASTINDTLKRLPANYSYDSFCKYTPETKELIRCMNLFPNLKGAQDCITGETLNKTLDPTDTCNFNVATLGCSYKYTSLMCPTVLNAFKEQAVALTGCDTNYEASQEASSCDKDMEKACTASFNPPSYNNASKIIEFVCSGKSHEFRQCLEKVYNICRGEKGFNNTDLLNMLEAYNNETGISCSMNGTNSIVQCTSMFPTMQGYQECITGATLNKVIDPADVCGLLQTSADCTTKYVNLTCPEELDKLHEIVKVPPTCSESAALEQTSCDYSMSEACTMTYGGPTEEYSTELYYDFICSGRANDYMKCLQKVQDMCWSTNTSYIDSSATLDNLKYSINVSEKMCSDKKGFISFVECQNKLHNSAEVQNCVTTATMDTSPCSFSKAGIRCALNFMMKECPTAIPHYKSMLSTNPPTNCDISSIIDTLSYKLYQTKYVDEREGISDTGGYNSYSRQCRSCSDSTNLQLGLVYIECMPTDSSEIKQLKGTPQVAGSSTATLSMLSLVICIFHAFNPFDASGI